MLFIGYCVFPVHQRSQLARVCSGGKSFPGSAAVQCSSMFFKIILLESVPYFRNLSPARFCLTALGRVQVFPRRAAGAGLIVYHTLLSFRIWYCWKLQKNKERSAAPVSLHSCAAAVPNFTEKSCTFLTALGIKKTGCL